MGQVRIAPALWQSTTEEYIPWVQTSACFLRVVSEIANLFLVSYNRLFSLWRTKTKTSVTQACEHNFLQDCRAVTSPSSVKDELSQLPLHSGLLRVQLWKPFGLCVSFCCSSLTKPFPSNHPKETTGNKINRMCFSLLSALA